ncbi:MAG: AEC family transporter [Euzebyales bacterium]|nr:AEC family transporter [Euzebyales bacterium]
MAIFLTVVVPVMVILTAGALFARVTQTDVGPISKLSLYLLSPVLVFSYIADSSLTRQELGAASGFVVLYMVAMTAVGALVVVLLRWPRELLGPALLTTVFPNSGNYGLPVLLFAFGEAGFERGVAVVVLQFVLMYSVGVYFASMQGQFRRALLNIAKQPTVYAGLAGYVFTFTGIELPVAVAEPIRLVAAAGVPVLLLVLGMQLADTRLERIAGFVGVTSLVRLLLGPLVALGVVAVMGITGLLADVLVVQAAMPPAILMSLLAIEFDSRPDLVSGGIMLGTLLSFVTLVPLLALVERMQL